ncbi:MAG: hypothetical protein ACM3QZ_09980 [Solirubrobacterales bacterium]
MKRYVKPDIQYIGLAASEGFAGGTAKCVLGACTVDGKPYWVGQDGSV